MRVNNTNHAISWIVIYLVDSVIHLLNNPGLLYIAQACLLHHSRYLEDANRLMYMYITNLYSMQSICI